MINLEAPTKEPLKKILDNLSDGKYLIPNFQREYDWNANDINELLISIFSDYYIGNLLLWKTSKENTKALTCQNIEGYKSEKINSTTIVLDGQQRLTSLYYAFFNPKFNLKGRKTHVEFFINVKEFMNENYSEAIYYEWRKNNLIKLNNIDYLVKENIYPISKCIYSTFIYYKNEWFIKYIEKYGEQVAESFREKVIKILDDYNIPIIELKRDLDISKVCDIFEKINSRGIKLSIFDLLNSILIPHNIELKTNLWNNANQKLDFITDENKMYILQNMSIIEQNYCSAKYLYYLVPKSIKIIKQPNGENTSITLIQNSDEFISKWNNAVTTLEMAEEKLRDPQSEYGVLRKDLLPYASMLPIYAAILKFLNNNKTLNTAINNKKLKQWWYYSIFTNNYSSSVESTMAKDYQNLQKWFNNKDNDIENLIKKYKDDFNLDLYKERNGSAIYKAILNLIIANGAKNFYEEGSLTINNLQDHHIVPKAFCERQKIKNKYINSILNRTLIYDKTNNDIKDKAPRDYINNIKEKYSTEEEMEKMFEKHFISKEALKILRRENFSSNDFEDFIKEREKTILEYIKTNIFEI